MKKCPKCNRTYAHSLCPERRETRAPGFASVTQWRLLYSFRLTLPGNLSGPRTAKQLRFNAVKTGE